MWKLFKDWAWRFIHEHSKVFWAGAATGGITIGNWIFSVPDILNSFWLAFAGKMFATICSAALSGFVTSLFVDYYKHKWKHRFFKQKDKEDGKEDRA